MTNTPQALAAQRAKRQAFVARGLTTYGTPRRNYQWPELAGLTGRARMIKRVSICNKKRRKMKAAGLWFRVKLVYGRDRLDVEQQKILFRAHLDSAVAALNLIFLQLDPAAKQRCLQLGRDLSAIRRKFL